MKKLFLLALLVLNAFINIGLIAQQIVQITNNDSYDGKARISGNNVIWLNSTEPGVFLGESALYYYNLEEQDAPVALTANDLILREEPQISGNRILWADLEEPDVFSDREIYYYELGNQDSPIQFTHNNLRETGIHLVGNQAVWAAGNDNFSANTTIYYYDFDATDQEAPIKLVDDGEIYTSPFISGNDMAWVYADGSDSEIMYYNLETQAPPLQLSYDGVLTLDPKFTATI